ncbi:MULTISPECIES: flagellar hook-associated protein FlgK [Aminobacterium]|jgi:flagellar hook-associated protein 1 FlgK|uniref:flagellar hook-associated protein FlgK n=1 Tax=Aminobacterium TaxID=81466 RepID=UPI002580533B|nr:MULTISPECIES: flagellar hook-associated protein FlgK [unclassified Aminobacterium]
MFNSFFGLEMGRRAMDYFRRAMETAGHNISNANVEGYSRQRVEASSTDPYTVPGLSRPGLPGQIGTGVKIDAIRRLRDDFLDLQFREETSVQGYWEVLEKSLNTIELYVNEPAGEGFKVALDEYWKSLEELHKRPDVPSVRETVVQSAQNLTVFMDQLVRNYDQYRQSLDQEVVLKVQEANDYIDQIAALNRTIAKVQGVGGNPNDLLDRRDLLVEKLSELVDVEVSLPSDMDDGDFKVYLHGKLLVQGDKTRHLVAVSVPGNEGFHDVQVEDNLFDIVDNTDVLFVTPGQNSPEGVHSVYVDRLASETAWKIGGGSSSQTPRLRPQSETEALNIRGSFSLSVGSQGVLSRSKILPSDTILASGKDGDAYSFRVAAGSEERIISIVWNDADGKWDLSDGTNTSQSADGTLSLTDLNGFLNTSLASAQITASLDGNQLTLRSGNNHLLSITDMKGHLMSDLGLNMSGKKVSIDVTEEDSLETIRNKINAAYGEEGGPNRPEEWLHAAIEKDEATGTYFLTLESNVVGEGTRINVMGDENGSLNIARRLGLLGDQDATSCIKASQDAVFSVDGKTYLSSSNALKEARRVPRQSDYSASVLEEVSSGLRFELRGVGQAGVTIKHHVKGGAMRGLMEARDDMILGFIDQFDEITYGLVTEINARHYAGHGTGDSAMTTGVAFFEQVGARYGASRRFAFNSAIDKDSSLIAAARGDGTGHSKGSGDGSNALALAQLKQGKVIQNRSASFNEYYLSFLAELGSRGLQSKTMATNQRHLTLQIDAQRQSTMGVNMDEEMLDIIKFQQAFNAMARYITTIDEMLDRLINGMGIVGR